MRDDLQRLRIERYSEQRGRCIYCCAPMWERLVEPQGMALLRVRHLRPEQNYDRLGNLDSFACTAEHLVPQALGGTDDPDNIAAACALCNNSRNLETVVEWQQVVGRRQGQEFQGTDQVPMLDGGWKTETALFKWRHVVHLEVPPVDVQMFLVTLDDTFKRRNFHHLQKSIAVIFPAFDGSLAQADLDRAYEERMLIVGTRAAFENESHVEAVERHFSSRVVRFTIREAASSEASNA